MKYSVLYYFGDSIKGKWHKGHLVVSDFKIYLVRDDKTIFALDDVIDGYLINIPRYEQCIKLYFYDKILNFFVIDTYFWGLISSPALDSTQNVFKKIVRKNKIGVYK